MRCTPWDLRCVGCRAALADSFGMGRAQLVLGGSSLVSVPAVATFS